MWFLRAPALLDDVRHGISQTLTKQGLELTEAPSKLTSDDATKTLTLGSDKTSAFLSLAHLLRPVPV